MLTLYHAAGEIVIPVDDYYIRQLASGLDEVIFEIPIREPVYALLAEEDPIVDRAGQRYLVKQIDAGAERAKVICQLDLDAWRSAMFLDYSSDSKTVRETLESIAPAGWTVIDFALYGIRRTIEGNLTALQIAEECRDVFKVYIRWDNSRRIATIYPQAMGDPTGAFATRELNLREINYKGKSTDFATRLYPYGKDGLTIEGAEISGEIYPLPYVQNNTYSDKIISAYWKDERYTVVQSLYDDAVARLAQMAKPARSYDCAVVDLQATNPELYGNQRFDLFSVATLVDDVKGTAINYQVVERHDWPYYPEKNEVIFDAAPPKITNTVTRIADAIDNTGSEFQQMLQAEIDLATDWLTAADSYCRIVQNPDGSWKELLFFDGTQDIETATHVMRLNSAGLGFSKSGVGGPYTNAFVFDSEYGGHLIADVITAGSMSAARVRTGSLISVNQQMTIDLDAGTITLGDKCLQITAGNFTLDEDGSVVMTGTVTAQAGSAIGPWNVSETAIWRGNETPGRQNGLYFGTDGLSISDAFRVLASGSVRIKDGTLTLAQKAAIDSGDAGVYIGADGIGVGEVGGRSAFIARADGFMAATNIRMRSENYLSRYGWWTDSSQRITTGGNIFINTEGIAGSADSDHSTIAGILYLDQPPVIASDRDLKKDIQTITDEQAERFVYGARPVQFRYKADQRELIHHGLIAQEAEELTGDWALVEKYQERGAERCAVNYTEIVADLIRVIQIQKTQMDGLAARITALEEAKK